MPDLAVRLGALELKSPVICGAGEHVADEEGLRAAIDAGAAAVVGKSANESDAARRQYETREQVLLDDRRRVVEEAPVSFFNRSGLVPLGPSARVMRGWPIERHRRSPERPAISADPTMLRRRPNQ